MKKKFYYLLIFILIVTISIYIFYNCKIEREYSINENDKDVFFQSAPIDYVLKGIFDGNMTFESLKKYGDFGLGTLNGLDGEMACLDGIFYQIKTDGIAYPIEDSMKTPFAEITFFEADATLFINEPLSYAQLKDYLFNSLNLTNQVYAFKIEGYFDYVKMRSVPKQIEPYPPLDIALQNQTIFEIYNQKGILVGFWLPDYIEGINVPFFHFHFITEDKLGGGHLLDCHIQNVTVQVDYTSKLFVIL